jgi:hypothetical protein
MWRVGSILFFPEQNMASSELFFIHNVASWVHFIQKKEKKEKSLLSLAIPLFFLFFFGRHDAKILNLGN